MPVGEGVCDGRAGGRAGALLRAARPARRGPCSRTRDTPRTRRAVNGTACGCADTSSPRAARPQLSERTVLPTILRPRNAFEPCASRRSRTAGSCARALDRAPSALLQQFLNDRQPCRPLRFVEITKRNVHDLPRVLRTVQDDPGRRRDCARGRRCGHRRCIGRRRGRGTGQPDDEGGPPQRCAPRRCRGLGARSRVYPSTSR